MNTDRIATTAPSVNNDQIPPVEHWRAIASGENGSVAAHLARVGLAILEQPYRLAVAGRNRLFDWGLRRSMRLPAPVISVGNLTVGGTGKTPLVIELVRRLQAMGRSPAVLLRGYAATNGQSDEAVELASALGAAVPVVADADRVRGADKAMRQSPKTDVFVLDDGFQHRRVHRDLDLVLIDATQPLGFNHLLPRGLLRESKTGLRRADAVIVTRFDSQAARSFEVTSAYLFRLAGRSPVAYTRPRWSGWRDAQDQAAAREALKIARPYVVCAIGNPQAFAQMARSELGVLAGFEAWPDHYPFTFAQIMAVMNRALQADAGAIILTEKDWVKWRPHLQVNAAPSAPPIYRPTLNIEFIKGADALEALVKQAIDQNRV